MKKDFLRIDVTKDFPEFRLTANLTVAEGEFFSLVGPSGCGKTTLLRLISGLLQPDHGRIILNGRDLTAVPVAERRIGFVFQDYALFPHLTVGENIEYGLKVRRLPAARRRERVRAMLAVFEITALADRRVQELSGGERQRVALARALAPEPFLLLLDEPFAALDYGLRRRLRRELKELQSRLGFTAIFVTHHQEEALSLSERLAVMQAGRILQVGTATEVYTNPPTLCRDLSRRCQPDSVYGNAYRRWAADSPPGRTGFTLPPPGPVRTHSGTVPVAVPGGGDRRTVF